jgi:hypothetical protein
LDYNHFTGAILIDIGDLAALTDLQLDGKGLAGSLPSQLGKVSVLSSLDLSNFCAIAYPKSSEDSR